MQCAIFQHFLPCASDNLEIFSYNKHMAISQKSWRVLVTILQKSWPVLVTILQNFLQCACSYSILQYFLHCACSYSILQYFLLCKHGYLSGLRVTHVCSSCNFMLQIFLQFTKCHHAICMRSSRQNSCSALWGHLATLVWLGYRTHMRFLPMPWLI